MSTVVESGLSLVFYFVYLLIRETQRVKWERERPRNCFKSKILIAAGSWEQAARRKPRFVTQVEGSNH